MVLVERTGVDRSTLSDLVARLQRKGLLQRRRTKEDSRAYAVSLTPAGRRVLQKAEPVARRVDQRLLQSLPEKQRQRFLDALHSVIATLQRT
jgi:MarR family transcriptional regulator, temperature-dependent positive regulator of motility